MIAFQPVFHESFDRTQDKRRGLALTAWDERHQLRHVFNLQTRNIL